MAEKGVHLQNSRTFVPSKVTFTTLLLALLADLKSGDPEGVDVDDTERDPVAADDNNARMFPPLDEIARRLPLASRVSPAALQSAYDTAKALLSSDEGVESAWRHYRSDDRSMAEATLSGSPELRADRPWPDRVLLDLYRDMRHTWGVRADDVYVSVLRNLFTTYKRMSRRGTPLPPL